MAHAREVFPSLIDGSGNGVPLHRMLVGDAPAAKNGLLAFGFRDSSGNVVLPQLNSEGKLPVTSEGAGVALSGTSDGEVAGSATEALIAEIALTASKKYTKIRAKGSCLRETIWYLYQVDDSTETILSHGITGPGQYDMHINLGSAEIEAGASGTQKFELRAKNLSADTVSDFMGDLSALEMAGA